MALRVNDAWDGDDGVRRRGIHAGLLRVGAGAADLWADLCLLLANSTAFRSTTHLVGHALRELDSMLVDLLTPDDYVADGADENTQRRNKIRAIALSPSLDPERHRAAGE